MWGEKNRILTAGVGIRIIVVHGSSLRVRFAFVLYLLRFAFASRSFRVCLVLAFCYAFTSLSPCVRFVFVIAVRSLFIRYRLAFALRSLALCVHFLEKTTSALLILGLNFKILSNRYIDR
jgi:hypothetical protein